MMRAVLIVLCFLLLTACGDGTGAPPAAAGPEALPPPDPQDPMISGHELYQEFCASCHDTGLGGAPVVGNPADWQDRSGLWVAVLTEHARSGYLEMPARGGESRLSDLAVSHAVEHMMLKTFPEKRPD